MSLSCQAAAAKPSAKSSKGKLKGKSKGKGKQQLAPVKEENPSAWAKSEQPDGDDAVDSTQIVPAEAPKATKLMAAKVAVKPKAKLKAQPSEAEAAIPAGLGKKKRKGKGQKLPKQPTKVPRKETTPAKWTPCGICLKTPQDPCRCTLVQSLMYSPRPGPRPQACWRFSRKPLNLEVTLTMTMTWARTNAARLIHQT